MNFSSYAENFLRQTDELLTNMFSVQEESDEGDDDPNYNYIPPPPSIPPPPTPTQYPPAEIVQTKTLNDLATDPLFSSKPPHLPTEKKTNRPSSLFPPETKSNNIDSVSTIDDDQKSPHKRILPPPPNVIKDELGREKVSANAPLPIKATSAYHESIASSSDYPRSQFSEAHSQWSSSSFTNSQPGASSSRQRIILPSYPVYERDFLIEPPGMTPMPASRVNKAARVREVVLLDLNRALQNRQRAYSATKLRRLWQWMCKAMDEEGMGHPRLTCQAFHYCELLDLFSNVEGCRLLVDMVRMFVQFKYAEEDITAVLASSLSCLEHVLGTKAGGVMDSKERAHVAVLQCYLCHCWLLDHFLPLSEWYDRFFADFCSRRVLRGALMRLWSLRDKRLGVNEMDVKKKSELLLRNENIEEWIDNSEGKGG